MPGMYCAFAEAGVLSFPGRNITSKSRIKISKTMMATGVDDLFHSKDNDLGFGAHGRPPGMFVIIYSQGFSFMLY